MIVRRLRGLVADTRPLRNEYFRRLWLANIVTVVGAQLDGRRRCRRRSTRLTDLGAPSALTGSSACGPASSSASPGGALADVFDRRSILIVTTSGLIATSVLFQSRPRLATPAMVAAAGCSRSSRHSSRSTSPPQQRGPAELFTAEFLPAANSLNMTIVMAGHRRPADVGVLIPVLGFSWLYLIDAISLFATLSAVVWLPRLPVEGVTGSPACAR